MQVRPVSLATRRPLITFKPRPLYSRRKSARYPLGKEVSVAQLVKALCYKQTVAGSISHESLEFLIGIILPAALWPWG
jgi:hypothetical protein